MRRLIAICAWLAIAACSSSGTAAKLSPSPQPSSSPAVQRLPGGCEDTYVRKGGEPAWLTAAGAGNNPQGVPYVITDGDAAAGFLFANPLRAGNVSNPNNKILWVVRYPRDGSNLTINGHPANASSPVVEFEQAPNSGPGEIYPSIFNVPTAGCWHFDLAWDTHQTSVSLVYA